MALSIVGCRHGVSTNSSRAPVRLLRFARQRRPVSTADTRQQPKSARSYTQQNLPWRAPPWCRHPTSWQSFGEPPAVSPLRTTATPDQGSPIRLANRRSDMRVDKSEEHERKKRRVQIHIRPAPGSETQHQWFADPSCCGSPRPMLLVLPRQCCWSSHRRRDIQRRQMRARSCR